MLPRANPAAICERVAEGAVLLHREAEVYFGLNAVALRIWELLPVSRDLDELCTELGVEYPGVDPAELRRDVLELLEALAASDLVVDPTVAPDLAEVREDHGDLALPAH